LKRRALERHLRACGCEPLREGANHAIWVHPQHDLRAPVPRHGEIPIGTARAICRQLSIPAPTGPR
jgi:predicted RNA binding protein YcfA (HicA-like mRNA interferase family)